MCPVHFPKWAPRSFPPEKPLCLHHLRARNFLPPLPSARQVTWWREILQDHEKKQHLVQKSPGRSLLALQRSKTPSFPVTSAHSPEPALRVEAEGRQGRSRGDPGRTPSRPGTPPGSLRPTRGPPRSSATEKRFPLSPGSRLQKCKFISK